MATPDDEPSVRLSLPEQLLLVALDPVRGRVGGAPSVYVAMAGGLVQDLVDTGAVGLDDGKLSVPDPEMAGAEQVLPPDLYDAAIAAMAGERTNTVKHWVGRFAAPKFRLGQRVTAAAERRGTLRTERSHRFLLFPAEKLVLVDPAVRDTVLAHARAALADIPPSGSPRAQALLMLVDAAGLLDRVVEPARRAAAHERIAGVAGRFASSDPVHQVTAQVQVEIHAAVIAATTAATVST